MSNPFYDRDIVSIRDFAKDDLEFVFDATDSISRLRHSQRGELGKGRTLGYIFYEPSTRTRMSFEAAMASLGGSSIGIADLKSSSVEKGESLADTIRNAGSGSEEHPTQALLDMYTILKEKGRIDGLSIAIIGDLKYGRTVYSLLYGLANYEADIYLVSTPSLAIRKESIYEVQGKLRIKEHNQLDDSVLSEADVIYVTRIQRERFPDIQEYEKVKGTYTIDEKTLAKSKPDVAIMHPLPRVDEISQAIDHTKNAIYFKQASYGKELRAALLALMLNESLP